MVKIVKNHHGQKKLIVNKDLKKGSCVVDLAPRAIYKDRDLRTIEITPNIHIDHPLARYSNHHCDPTCYIDKTTKTIRALRDLTAGDEVSFDYLLNESVISSSFYCNCGSKVCKGFIGTEHSKPSYLEPLPTT